MKHAITISVSDEDICYLSALYGARKNTKPATLVTMTVRRAVAEGESRTKENFVCLEENVVCVSGEAHSMDAEAIRKMIDDLKRMIEIWDNFDIIAYEQSTGDNDAAADVPRRLKGMISELRGKLEEMQPTGLMHK